MIRVIKQYGISILLLIVAIFSLFNIGQNIQDAFTVITNSLAIFLAIFYFVNFEQDIIIKIKKFVLNIKWPFHGKTKRILTNFLNFIIEKRWNIVSYLFIFLLLIITLGQFSYLERFINLSWINKYQVILTVLAILSGGLTFWHNRERINRRIVKKTKKDKKILLIEIFIFLVIIINFYSIAIKNLDVLPLQNDEFLTYEAVDYILNSGISAKDLLYGSDKRISPDFYSRSMTYSFGVAGTIKLMEGSANQIFDLRIFSVLIGGITLLLIYLFFRANLPITLSLIITYFFSISYIFVYHSRVSRMYSLVLLITSLIILFFIKIYKNLELNTKIPPTILINRIKKNFLLIMLFCTAILLGAKTHYNTIFILYPILIFTIIYTKSKYLKIISGGIFFTAITLLVWNYLGFGFIDPGYFNGANIINFNYIERLFEQYNYGLIMLVFIIAPLATFKYLPLNIKLSYLIFFFIYLFFLFFVNGTQFHDPRYFIFLFPFYAGIFIYSFYLFLQILIPKKQQVLKYFILFFSIIIFMQKLQIAPFCKDGILTSCPISNENKIFNLDRWNYQYDDIYALINQNLTNNTMLVSRTLHNFYSNKYAVSQNQQCKLITNHSKQQECEWDKIINKEIIFVVYPQLVYPKFERSELLESIYNYLYFNENRELIYKSYDSKVFIYKIKN